ncbi:TraT conjugal transfer protein [Salmonella enterica subsp. enterica serovar Typhimurium]|uniref:TraT conjugal transfer protein n=1 Tax=Salmonella enterica TaxID=28901 RepID=UPI001600A8EF|nr:TraT conjugal transfer protein [Salmonella enterica]ELV9460694.1 TraT conjugal transfer protein [Salmonella enterica]
MLTFSTGQQVWGHEARQPDPAHLKLAHDQSAGHCLFCDYASPHNLLHYRDGNPDNTAPGNLTVICPLCAAWQSLERLGANDGVIVYLPEVSPEDINHLVRNTLWALQSRDGVLKKQGQSVMDWLIAHRQATEDFWGTSHPGEFAQALLQVPPENRSELQHRLEHLALIVNPAHYTGHPALAPDTTQHWGTLYQNYLQQDVIDAKSSHLRT